MSALNMTETEQLRAVRSIIDAVRRDGYDPEGTDAKSAHFKKALEQASAAVNTITQMKGYYPSS